MRDLWFRSVHSDVVAPNLLGGRATALLGTTGLVRAVVRVSEEGVGSLFICYDLQLDMVDHECSKRRRPLLLHNRVVESPLSPVMSPLENPLRRFDGNRELLLSRTQRGRGAAFNCHLYEATRSWVPRGQKCVQ